MKHIILSSVGQQSNRPTATHKLYQSPWFKACRRYALKLANGQYPQIWVLTPSGLTNAQTITQPHSAVIKSITADERMEWVRSTVQQIHTHIPQGSTIIILAGRWYQRQLTPQLQGYIIETPLKGKTLDEQRIWLQKETAQ